MIYDVSNWIRLDQLKETISKLRLVEFELFVEIHIK